MGWCDPCAADPLSSDELRQLGVFWLNEGSADRARILPWPQPVPGGPAPVMVTRLHLRYTHATFPEDLVFQQTADQENYQARYVLRHPWKGSADQCPAARPYFAELRTRHEQEATTLADLTGWKVEDIRRKMDLGPKPTPKAWWEGLWQ